MGAQHERRGPLGAHVFHDAPPEQARSPKLGDLHIEVHAYPEEEREPPRELVHIHAARQSRLHVLLAVGERERELKCGRRSGLVQVVTGDGDGVESRHVPRRVRDDVGHDAHGFFGRVDICVAHHELFEDVVLDRPGKLVLRHALLFGRDDVAGEHGEDRAVHGYGDRDLAQGNVREQKLHVLDRVHGYACHSHVACHPRVVGVVAPVRCEIEGHRDAVSARGESLTVESVRLLRRREPGVLADRPRTPRVHRRMRPSQEGLETRQSIGVRQILDVLRGVENLDREAVRRDSSQPVACVPRRRTGGAEPVGQVVGRAKRRAGGFVHGVSALLVSHLNSMTRWPTATLSPGLTSSRSTTQSWSALRTFSIFIASTTRSGSPTLTD